MPLSVQNPAVKWVFEPAVMSRSGVVSDALLKGTRFVVAIVSVHLLLFIWFVVQTVTLADQLVNCACHMIGLSSVTFHGFT